MDYRHHLSSVLTRSVMVEEGVGGRTEATRCTTESPAGTSASVTRAPLMVVMFWLFE